MNSHTKKMTNKDKHGEVFTPPNLVQEMYHKLLEYSDLYNNIRIFEPGAGRGAFYDEFHKLTVDPLGKYVMNEINDEHFPPLHSKIKEEDKTTLIEGDLFETSSETWENIGGKNSFDLVVGNLPFNSQGKKFVPSLASQKSKGNVDTVEKGSYGKTSSITIWTKMTHYCFENILKDGGYYYCIIPCIWLKPDNAGIYELFVKQYSIHYIKIYDCHSANKIFGYNCQTPVCYVLVQKTPRVFAIDKQMRRFDMYDHIDGIWKPFTLMDDMCIPTSQISMFSKHVEYFTKHHMGGETMGTMVKKISCMRKDILDHKINDCKGPVFLEDSISDEGYKVITGSMFDKIQNKLRLTGFTCKNPGLYHGIKKLILPHKRLAKFIVDDKGEYGLSGRDMFVFLCDEYSDEDLLRLYDFFCLPHIQEMITSGFRIRMNFIEKYVFSYIPWILSDDFDMNGYLSFVLSSQ